ncbi:MAG TPA: dethiobiotin synthase, partial [Xanthobacteraceae bacterium]
MTAIFITATGSDVGKTQVVASLIRQFRQMGRSVEAVKPIVSGYDPAQAAASDTGILISALALPFTPESIDRISPWRFRTALPPDLAARQEDRTVDIDALIAFCQGAVSERRDVLLIEGVGGIMTPLDGHRTTLDVMM